MPTTAIVWFRRDLRIHDHPSLTAARRERVVPAFVLDRRLLHGRFPSAARAEFLLGWPGGAARRPARPRRRPRRPAGRARASCWSSSQQKRFDPDGEYVRRWVPELRGPSA